MVHEGMLDPLDGAKLQEGINQKLTRLYHAPYSQPLHKLVDKATRQRLFADVPDDLWLPTQLVRWRSTDDGAKVTPEESSPNGKSAAHHAADAEHSVAAAAAVAEPSKSSRRRSAFVSRKGATGISEASGSTRKARGAGGPPGARTSGSSSKHLHRQESHELSRGAELLSELQEAGRGIKAAIHMNRLQHALGAAAEGQPPAADADAVVPMQTETVAPLKEEQVEDIEEQ